MNTEYHQPENVTSNINTRIGIMLKYEVLFWNNGGGILFFEAINILKTLATDSYRSKFYFGL